MCDLVGEPMKKKKPKKSRKKKKESEFARKKIVNENVSDSEDSDEPPDKPPPKPINLDIIRMKCRADWLILCYYFRYLLFFHNIVLWNCTTYM